MEVLIIGGLDISEYIQAGGLKFDSNDLDAPSSGRTQDGLMHRSVVASKVKMQISCLPVPDRVTRQLFPILKRPFFEVVYRDPGYGLVHGQFYSNGRHGELTCVTVFGVELWDGVTFPLIER